MHQRPEDYLEDIYGTNPQIVPSAAKMAGRLANHGPLRRSEAERRLAAVTPNKHRYLVRTKRGGNTGDGATPLSFDGLSMILSYTLSGTAQTQHVLITQPTRGTFLANTKAIRPPKSRSLKGAAQPISTFPEATAAVLGALAAKGGGHTLKPVWPSGGGGTDASTDSTMASLSRMSGWGSSLKKTASVGYQNTTYEALSAFLSELRAIDRQTAEKMLLDNNTDGRFILRRKTDTTAVISCLSRGKIEHHIIKLTENRDKNGASWSHKQTKLGEISMVEAAKGVLLDAHVRNPVWLNPLAFLSSQSKSSDA